MLQNYLTEGSILWCHFDKVNKKKSNPFKVEVYQYQTETDSEEVFGGNLIGHNLVFVPHTS